MRKGQKMTLEQRAIVSMSKVGNMNRLEEIHGEDVVVELTHSELVSLHARLRKEDKCKIPPKELASISNAARKRRLRKEMIDNGSV